MTAPVFQSFSEAKVSSPDNSITIDKPVGVVNGDLMIMVLVVDQQQAFLGNPAGWTLGQGIYDSAVSMDTWYKVASGEGSDYTFIWADNAEAYGFIMRITGHDSTTPVNVSGLGTGTSASPTCPTVTTTKEDCLLLRIFGADDDDITVDGGYPSGHTGITVDKSSATSGSCSGGAAWKNHAIASATGTAAFSLTASEEWIGITFAINSPEGVSASISDSPSASPSVSGTPSSSVSATVSLSASLSSTPSASISSTPSSSISASISASASSTASASISSSPSASASTTPSTSVSASPSSTPSASVSSTPSASVSLTPSASPSVSETASASVSTSPSTSKSSTTSPSPSSSPSVSASISSSPSSETGAYIDSSLFGVYTSGGTAQEVEARFENLGHLEGETVAILGTDVNDTTTEYPDEVVTNGIVDLGTAAANNLVRVTQIGLPYTYKLRPMRIVWNTPEGSTMGAVVRISEIIVSVLNTGAFSYGRTLTDLIPAVLPEVPYTGDVELVLNTDFDVNTDLYISSDSSMPVTIRAIIVRIHKAGR